MSALPVTPGLDQPVRTLPVRQCVRYLIFSILACLYLLPLMRLVLLGTNEGMLVDGAVRIVQGQVFARDFFEPMGPGTFYWLALFLKLFGVSFFAVRICLLVSSLGTGVLVYFLSRRICDKYQALPAIILAGTYYGMQWPGISHHVDSNFFALLSVALVVLWQRRRSDSLLIAAGVLAGFTTCCHQPKGMLLLLSLLLSLLIQQRRRFARPTAPVLLVVGYLAALVPVLLWFWSQGALRSLVYANFIWPSLHYGAINSVPYALGLFDQYWKHWLIAKGAFNWSIGMAAILITPFLFVAALPVLVPILGLIRKREDLKPEVVLYLLCGCALWLSEMHRKDIYHLVFGSPLLMIVCIYLLQESMKKIADYALQILLITATCLAALNFFVAFVAHSVPTRVGAVAMFKTEPVLTFLDEHLATGEDLFVYPCAPMYYFLLSASNPTRYSTLVYNYNTTSEFKDAIAAIEQHKVRYVLWDTNYLGKKVFVIFPNWRRLPPSGTLMEPYLVSHYSVVKDLDGVRILERKQEAPAR